MARCGPRGDSAYQHFLIHIYETIVHTVVLFNRYFYPRFPSTCSSTCCWAVRKGWGLSVEPQLQPPEGAWDREGQASKKYRFGTMTTGGKLTWTRTDAWSQYLKKCQYDDLWILKYKSSYRCSKDNLSPRKDITPTIAISSGFPVGATPGRKLW